MADDKTPPQITTGSFVSWSNGKGRVDLIVSKGTVPGVKDDVEATSDSPAARVVVWEGGKPTKRKIAASTHTLRRIAPLDSSSESKTGAAALVAMHGEHEEWLEGAGKEASLSGAAIKAAYDRGVQEWPGAGVTSLTSEEWGLGRAAHLCKAARGEVEETNDADLLHPEHPVAVKTFGAQVVISAATVEADFAAIMAEAGPSE